MTKELEALENLCDIKIVLNKQMRAGDELQFSLKNSDDYKIIEKALQRLEEIDNAKPSEALKYVNGKIADLEDDLQHYTMVEKDKCREFYIREDLKQFTNIKQALIKAQEQEKVLKIIKEKYVEIYILLKSKNVEQYNFNIRFGKQLTQEEFDLLKRCCE